MKIACLATSAVPSLTANSIQVMKVCSALAGLGHQVCLWVPGSRSHRWEALASHYGLRTPFEVRWLPSRPFFKKYDFVLKAASEARQWGADLLYTWALQAVLPGVWRGRPLVLELHDLPTGRIGPWLFRRAASRKAKTRILVITTALHKKLESAYALPAPPPDFQIAPNGVDLRHYLNLPAPAEARRRIGLSERPTAIFSGHFYPGRGQDLLLGLAQSFPRTGFLWVGGSPEKVAEWKTRLEGLGIRNVTLTGFVENALLPLYLAAGEILLMPYEEAIAGSSGGNSAEICSPMKMFDYLACGRAILTSDLPVLHEVLNPANAVFCPPGDVSAWSHALGTLLKNPERCFNLGEQARKDAARYTWEGREKKALEGFGGHPVAKQA